MKTEWLLEQVQTGKDSSIPLATSDAPVFPYLTAVGGVSNISTLSYPDKASNGKISKSQNSCAYV